MAIGRSKGPRVIAVGEVSRVQEKTAKSSGEVYAHDITLNVGDGASVFVRVWSRDDAVLSTVRIGELFAAWCEVISSREYGDSLNFEQVVSPDDLDRINSAILAPAGK